MLKVRIMIIQFKNHISFRENESLRSSVLKTLHNDCDVLFHNHTRDNYRYAYPLIQYKRIRGQAAIVCLQEGTDDIGTLLSHKDMLLTIKGSAEPMEIESVRAYQNVVQVWDNAFCYTIRKWLALNETNYKEYNQKESLRERCEILEKILIGNIIVFAKGLGIQIDNKIECVITQMSEPETRKYKDTFLMSFDCCFKTNVSLPDYIGLGKGVSLGYGMIKRMQNTEIEKETE